MAYCENCGCKEYNRFCTNCDEEKYIENQYIDLGMEIPNSIYKKSREQEKRKKQ